jgi:hypothetical protein
MNPGVSDIGGQESHSADSRLHYTVAVCLLYNPAIPAPLGMRLKVQPGLQWLAALTSLMQSQRGASAGCEACRCSSHFCTQLTVNIIVLIRIWMQPLVYMI